MMKYQCKFAKIVKNETHTVVGYVEERAAKLGARVELKGESGIWTVIAVDDKPMSDEYVHENQKKNRKALPSILTDMVKD